MAGDLRPTGGTGQRSPRPSPALASATHPSRRPVTSRPSLERALRRAVRGEVSFDASTRAVYATDSSNYRHVPIAAVFPVDHDDVVAAMEVCAAHDAPILARGAGTSLAGQTCNAAVVLDLSRHMTRIVEVDPKTQTARVQPGVVLDDLRRFAAPHGLTFGPDPATHAWCTIGGMIGNNACGSHALYAGRTVDNVDRLTAVLYGGQSIDVSAHDAGAREAEMARRSPLGTLLGELEELVARHRTAIATGFPTISRRASGYNLDQLLPDHGFHVARALVGSEGTCAVITEATVHLAISPRHRCLIVLGYPDIYAAADAVPSLLHHPLLALEGFDVTLVSQMRARSLNVEHLRLLPEGRGWLIAELGANDRSEAESLVGAFLADIPGGISHRRYDDLERQNHIWLLRESGLGATAIGADGTHMREGWEDAAVVPEKLGMYLREITRLWSEFGYSGAWYGHFGQGCVHTRNNFDFATPDGVRAFRRYVERAADLTVALGGSLSGEHGDGQARGELLSRMYSPQLLDAFRAFKAVFDPRGRMNPGRLIDARPLDTDLRFGPGYRHDRLPRTRFHLLGPSNSLQTAAERCVGVGRCRRDDAGTMCPSYRITRDERHSTRGRAKLLTELFQGQVTPATWRNRDVREALDLCLSCKGCAVDCPTQVDMASYKAEFLARYYRRRLRPRSMLALGLLPWMLRWGTRAPRLLNALLHARVPGTLFRRALGITTARPAPALAPASFRRIRPSPARRDDLSASVLLWPDTFTDAFRPEVGTDLIALLEAAGERVTVPSRWACCARTLYDGGMLQLAQRSLAKLLDVLDPWITRGVPVVVPEPSCLSAFRDELPALMAHDPRAAALASLARSPAEHLLSSPGFASLLRGRPAEPDPEGDDPAVAGTSARPSPRVALHPHCHSRPLRLPAVDRALLQRVGFSVDVVDAGCCGLAGSFGYSQAHEAISRRIGEQLWLPRLRAATGLAAELVIDGYSCTMQLEHLAELRSTPLVTLVRRRLGL